MSYWRTRLLSSIIHHALAILGLLSVSGGVIWFVLGEAPSYIRVVAYIGVITLIILIYANIHIVATLADIKDILDERLPKKMSNPNPSNRKKEEEIKTTGAGALVGMAIGGLLGLPFGALGVIAGGVLGAIIGDQIEYELLRAEKRKRR